LSRSCDPETVSRLTTRGLVAQRAAYRAVADDTERLEGYGGYERATALFTDQPGVDTDAWRDRTS
jgi:hypothetical protein